jgi:hypothetical protein
VIHPLATPVTAPQVLSESRKEAVYPDQWRSLHLGARVILQGVVEKNGILTKVDVLNTEFRVEPDCVQPPGNATGNQTGGGAPDDSGDQVAPPGAAKDFEASAMAAVKAWRFRPGTQNGSPVAVYYTLIVDFTSCSTGPKSQGARPSPRH